MTKTQTPTTDVLVVGVLDRSGSMSSCLAGAIEGWNDYLKDLQADESGETFLWLTGFDTTFDHWEQGTPIKQVPFLKQPDGTTPDYPAFIPRGGTALYDAIANSIVASEEYLKKIGRDATSDNPMKVLHVTLTDGGENSSKEYPGQAGAGQLRKLVKTYESKGNWSFVFLGANQDAHVAGASMGYSVGSTANFAQSAHSYKRVGATLSTTTSGLRHASTNAVPDILAASGQSQELGEDEAPIAGTAVPGGTVTPGGVYVPVSPVQPTGAVPPAPEPSKAAEKPVSKSEGLGGLLGEDEEA